MSSILQLMDQGPQTTTTMYSSKLILKAGRHSDGTKKNNEKNNKEREIGFEENDFTLEENNNEKSGEAKNF